LHINSYLNAADYFISWRLWAWVLIPKKRKVGVSELWLLMLMKVVDQSKFLSSIDELKPNGRADICYRIMFLPILRWSTLNGC